MNRIMQGSAWEDLSVGNWAIGVVGAGVIDRGITRLFAASGYDDVHWFDIHVGQIRAAATGAHGTIERGLTKGKATAIELFEAASFTVVVCADKSSGRILNHLDWSNFNSAPKRLDDGFATADEMDRSFKVGLDNKRGPIAWLTASSLAEHCSVSEVLSEVLDDSYLRPV